MVAWYYHLYVAAPVSAGYGLWIGGAAMVLAMVLSVLTMVVGWAGAGGGR
jgi:NCAIR mutase (PurE)-related protein